MYVSVGVHVYYQKDQKSMYATTSTGSAGILPQALGEPSILRLRDEWYWLILSLHKNMQFVLKTLYLSYPEAEI